MSGCYAALDVVYQMTQWALMMGFITGVTVTLGIGAVVLGVLNRRQRA